MKIIIEMKNAPQYTGALNYSHSSIKFPTAGIGVFFKIRAK